MSRSFGSKLPQIPPGKARTARLLVLALAVAPVTGQNLDEIGQLLASGRSEEALEALQASPAESARWHLLASKALDALRRPAEAAREAESAVRVDPGCEACRLQLGQLFLSHNNPAAALETFEVALGHAPGSVLLAVGKGLALNHLRRYDEAESAFSELLGRDPALGIAFGGLAEALLEKVRYHELARRAAQYRSANPGDFRGHYYAALASDRTGGPSEAIEQFARGSVERNSRFAPAYALLGKTLLRRGRPEEAVLMLESALRLDADNLQAHLQLSRAYRVLGRAREAESVFKRAQALQADEQSPKPVLRRSDESR